MMASRVTLLAKEEVDMDGAEEVGGVAVLVRGHFDQSWASLYLTTAASMVHIIEKCVDSKTGRAHV